MYESKSRAMVTSKYTNHLIHETSPYLLQHANNPVNWFPWGVEALEKARKEKKLILISIGYAACHWCHVMAHESFEDAETASIMNEHFVCIKIDREERPDLDLIYMEAIQLINGNGGWPLNCFTLPDGRPVFGGTYFTTKYFQQILTQLSQLYQDEPERIMQVASELTKGIANTNLVTSDSKTLEFTASSLEQIVTHWKTSLDTQWGGTLGSPKFPLPASLRFLLRYSLLMNDKQVSDFITLTLNKIADGGIYDQLGGGFARYSVDKFWKVPHFEKMLYDNGQLISLYSEAFRVSKSLKYKQVIEQTLNFISQEMTHPNGAFYSSFDADSEGVEGKFYVWAKKEIEQTLQEDAPLFCDYYSVTDKGNWERNNILYITDNIGVAKKYNLSESELAEKINKASSQLFLVRKNRIHPGLDDKILASWNALMAIGYLDAYRALGNPLYRDVAIKNAVFISDYLIDKKEGLKRNFKNNSASISAFLDDYGLVIQLFINCYQVTFDSLWLFKALNLMNYTIQHFFDDHSGLFFYTNNEDPALIARKMETTDHVIPSSNSIMATNLWMLGRYFENRDFIDKAELMVATIAEKLIKNGPYFANWGILFQQLAFPVYEVVFTGDRALENLREFEKKFIANTLISGTLNHESNIPILKDRYSKGENLIYVCQNSNCHLPVKTIGEALKLIILE